MENSIENHKIKRRFYFNGTALKLTGLLFFGICLFLAGWIKWIEFTMTMQVYTTDSNLNNIVQTVVPEMPPQFMTVLTLLIIFGLVCIAVAKEKVEDEFILALKLRSMRISFLIGILYVLVLPILNLFRNKPLTDYNGPGLIISMLLIYLVTFNILKHRALQ